MIAVRVACATGQPLHALEARPWAEVLYTYGHLAAERRRDRLQVEVDAFTTSRRAAVAFHKPEDLEADRQQLMHHLRGRTSPVATAQAQARADALIAADAAGTWKNAEAPDGE